MWKKLQQIWKAKDIRKNILYVLSLLVVFRIASHIPIPGVDASSLQSVFEQSDFRIS